MRARDSPPRRSDRSPVNRIAIPNGDGAGPVAGRDHPDKTAADEEALVRAEISWADFPLDENDLWYANNTLYLPSEH